MKDVKIVVIDAQGGGIGKQLIGAIRKAIPEARITAVGTNAAAAGAMAAAGAEQCAAGENAVLVNCRRADYILGPIGIVIADAMLGEITPAMAAAVGQSPAKRILIPFDHCDTLIVGASDTGVSKRIQGAVEILKKLLASPEEAP